MRWGGRKRKAILQGRRKGGYWLKGVKNWHEAREQKGYRVVLSRSGALIRKLQDQF